VCSSDLTDVNSWIWRYILQEHINCSRGWREYI